MGSPGAEGAASLPPPPPLAPNTVPLRADDHEQTPKAPKHNRLPMARPGFAQRGKSIQLLTNHFRVNVASVNGDFFHYSVSICYEDGHEVDTKGIGRKVMDKLYETYATDLAGMNFAYDGEKSLFIVGPRPQNKLEYDVVLDDISSNRTSVNSGGDEDTIEGDRKRSRRPYQSKTYKVELSYAASIPMRAIAEALAGRESERSQEALRVLDIVLRQNAAKKGCLLVRQSFFHDHPQNYRDLKGGVFGCSGFHSSFRATQGGLSLNVDVSTTMIVRPGPVADFLVQNQNVRNRVGIDWLKAKRTLKNLRIKARPSNIEYKITGISEHPCNRQLFLMKQKRDANGDGVQPTEIEITVHDYFVKHRGIPLDYSAELRCINVGKPRKPVYIPLELCSLVSLQRYTKALSPLQRSSLVEQSRQKPKERMAALSDALKTSRYEADQMLRASGVSIVPNFTQIDGRVLSTPKLRVGNEEFFPQRGRWNFNHKKLVEPTKVERWAIVNFSARYDIRTLAQDLERCGQQKGIFVEPPILIEENAQDMRGSPPCRVEKMFEQIRRKFPKDRPRFLLCLLSERKTSALYGPWKRKNLADIGIVTQCIAPIKVNDQYLTNVLLKINAKLGGLNSYLVAERSLAIPSVSNIPTIILGMDVSHGSPGLHDMPSIAAVVSSRMWPSISHYRAAVRTQPRTKEMIDSLYKKVPGELGEVDEGIVRELLVDFYKSSKQRKPEHVIIFRDGVSESQFNQVLNVELEQIMEACAFLDAEWSPKFTVIVAVKNHHTKFFLKGSSPDNVPPGTVIDRQICHPRNNDFYMCSHAGMIGTTRPTHYQVLFDQIGFSADDIQELVHALSYVYQRSTTAISIVAPIAYAHLAAAQMTQFMKFDEMSETSSGHGVTAAGAVPVPQLPRLHESVCSSMFFC